MTAAEGGYARHLAGLDRAPETDVHQRALDMTAQFGSGEVTAVGHRLDLEDLEAGPLAVFDAVDVTPTVAVQIGESFRDRRREHREATCRLLARLAQTCSLVVVAGPVTTRWFAREHREQLPTSFSEEYSTPQDKYDTGAAVDAALDALDRDSREVKLLRDLDSEPDETRSYSAVVGGHDVSQSRVSQLIGTLEDLGLAEKFGPRGAQQVELLPPGREFLDHLDSETTGQQTLDAEFSDTGHSISSAVLSAPHERGPQDAPAETTPGELETDPYETRYLGRATHHAAASSASDGAITAVRGPLQDENADDRRTRYVSFDDERSEAVVAVRAVTPLQYMTSVALGLASPRFLDPPSAITRWAPSG